MLEVKRKALPKSVRIAVYQKCNGHCAYCGCDLQYKDMQVDHVIPLNGWNEQGTDTVDNMLPACRSCNHYKSRSTLEGFRKMVEAMPDTLMRDNVTYITRFGNTRQKNVFKEFYKTNIGEFTPEKWLEVTLQIIQTLMENELLEEIKEHVAGHCVWLKNDKEIEEYSASCLASGAYMYWEDFKDKRLPAHKAFIFEGGDF